MTARGWALLVAGPLLVAVGYLCGYPELVVLGVAAVGSCGAAGCFVVLRPRLRVSRGVDSDRVTRGEPSIVYLTVSNGNRWREVSVVATDQCGDRAVDVAVLHLRRGQQTATSYPVPTHRRGVIDIGPLRIVRVDPLGLATASRTYGHTSRVWVHPVAHPLRAVPAGVARSLEGRVDKVPRGHGSFDSLREYVIGDDLRNVHWRTSARVGALMVRERTDTSLPVMVIVLDDRAAVHTPESFEESCDAAASIVTAALQEGLGVRLRLVSGAEMAGKGAQVAGKGGRDAFLDLLAEATLQPAAIDTQPAVERLRVGRLGDTLIYLTGPAGASDIPQIAALRDAYPVVVAGVLGESTAAPVAAPGMLVLAAATAQEFAAAWDGVGRW